MDKSPSEKKQENLAIGNVSLPTILKLFERHPASLLFLGLVFLLGVYSGITIRIGQFSLIIGDYMLPLAKNLMAVIGFAMLSLGLLILVRMNYGLTIPKYVDSVVVGILFVMVLTIFIYSFIKGESNKHPFSSIEYDSVDNKLIVKTVPEVYEKYRDSHKVAYAVIPHDEGDDPTVETRLDLEVRDIPEEGTRSVAIKCPNSMGNISYGDGFRVYSCIVPNDFSGNGITTIGQIISSGGIRLRYMGGDKVPDITNGTQLAPVYEELSDQEKKAFNRSTKIGID
ncbi:hypothetical protein [uncultured Gimesia sp.]|uniref:hypothetical protein n=1 Tax=uncultured Gimesia sp. TaxID=1678688 RepID=UPI0030D7BEF1|tara:strand:+ start:59231 stop:60079 length:849 start_codon:yes stop_codon:yes gene_type:complete